MGRLHKVLVDLGAGVPVAAQWQGKQMVYLAFPPQVAAAAV